MKFAEKYIPYSSHVSSAVVSTNKMGYVIGMKVMGISFQTQSNDFLREEKTRLDNVFKAIHEPNLTIHQTMIRHRTKAYPGGMGESFFAQSFMNKYKEGFGIDKQGMMQNDLFIFLHYAPFKGMARPKKLSTADAMSIQESSIRLLNDKAKILQGALNSGTDGCGNYEVEVLEVEERDGFLCSPLIEVFGYIVNGFWQPMPAFPRNRFNVVVPTSRLYTPKMGGGVLQEGYQGERLLGLAEVFEYPDETFPWMTDELLSLNSDLIITNTFECVSKAAALEYMKRQYNHMSSSGDAAKTQIKELEKAMDRIASGEVAMGRHHCIIGVHGDNPSAVDNALADIIGQMSTKYIFIKRLGMATEAAFFSQLPGNLSYRPRPSAITTSNFASFAPLHNFMTGKVSGNPLGDAVMMFKTTSGSPHFFSFHSSGSKRDETGERPAGHTLISGKTGAGKTTLLASVLTHFDKFRPRMMICDKDRGLQPWVLAMGGRYFTINPGEKTGWNPFQAEDSPKQRLFCRKLLESMAESDGEPVNHVDRAEIDVAIDTLYTSIRNVSDRSLSVLMESIPDHDDHSRPSLRKRLDKWVGDGERAWVFDNKNEMLDLSSARIFGFDFTHVLDIDAVRPVVVQYLLSRSKEMMDGIIPFVCSIDEYWRFDKDVAFTEYAEDMLLAKRKDLGALVLSTQSPATAVKSRISDSLLTQMATKIIMRDRGGDPVTYIEKMGLTLEEFNLIKSFGDNDHKFLIKQGGNSCVAIHDLSHAKAFIPVLSGNKVRGALAEEAISIYGDDVEKWLPYYLESVGESERKGRDKS